MNENQNNQSINPIETKNIVYNKKRGAFNVIAKKFIIISIPIFIAIFCCFLIPNISGGKSVSTITNSEYGVTITAQDKVFNNHSVLEVNKLSYGAHYEALVLTVNNYKSIAIQNAVIYDIECKTDIQDITIQVPYMPSSSDSTIKVFHISDSDTLIEEHSCIYKNGIVEFKTNHLSYYLIGEIETTSTSPDNTNPSTPKITIKEGVLQVAVCADYEPYEYIDNGELKGIEIDILKEIASELGLAIEFKNQAFEDMYDNLLRQNVDCVIGMRETDQRNEFCDASIPMFSEPDFNYIIYLKKECDTLQAAINAAISKLKNNGTIDKIINKYKNSSINNVVYVSTAQELLDKIGSNTTIVLTSSFYNLSNVKNVNNEHIRKVEYNTGYEIINVDNLIISGTASIVISDRYADVLSFENCTNVELVGLTIGHTEINEDYHCDGSVVELSDCSNIKLNQCYLFGCGSIGLSVWNSTDIIIKNSDIYDCNYAGISAYESQLQVENCRFYDFILFNSGGLIYSTSSNINFKNCSFENAQADILIHINDRDWGTDSKLHFESCSIYNNKYSQFTNNENCLKFTNCYIQ